MEEFNYLEGNNQIAKEYLAFRKKFALGISAGVSLGVLSVIAQLILSAYMGELFANIVFLLGIMFSVGIIIYFGILNVSYKSIVFKQEVVKKKKGVADKLSSVIMCSATIIFLVAGFLYHAWHPTWLVFPVSGLICSILESLLD